MKKLFVALMAVLVLASCGDKKEVAKTPGDVMLMAQEIFESTAVKFENAQNADDIINIMAEMSAEVNALNEKYGDVMAEVENLDEAAVEELYSKETEALNSAFVKYYEALLGRMDLMENLSPEQQERWEQILTAE